MTTEDAPPQTRRARRARLRAEATAARGHDHVASDAPAPELQTPADEPRDAAADAGDTTPPVSDAEITPPSPAEAPASEPTGTTDIAGIDDAADTGTAGEDIADTAAAPTSGEPAADTEAPAEPASEPAPQPAPEPEPTRGPRRIALAWVDEAAVAAASPALSLDTAASPYTTVQPDLLAQRPRRSPLRASVLVPVLSVMAVIAVYVATTLLWPLHALAPEVSATTITPSAAPAAAPVWPAEGGASVGVDGIDATAASTADPLSIASITKVVTVLMVLDEMPLAVGEQGPEFRFTAADQSDYWAYRERGESALPVPVDGALTQYQLIQGILIASANNYADRLASMLWPTDRVFASAAEAWLAQRGLGGITVVDPSGIDDDNAADPAALIALADRAMADPVVAEIVRMPTADLPGAGLIENTNALLADPGVVGIKTGALWQHFNLLVAKDLVIDETSVRVYASILGQSDGEARNDAARALLAQVESELQPRPSVPAGTVAGVVTTAWGERVDLVTAADASVVLWNGATPTVSADLAVGEDRQADADAGRLTVTGPLNAVDVEVQLADELAGPSAWWRLTHPLELFGLAG